MASGCHRSSTPETFHARTSAYATDDPQAFALVFDPEDCPPGDPEADTAPLSAHNRELLATEVAALGLYPGFEGRDPRSLAALVARTTSSAR